MKYTVYLRTNLINGKQYVGQTGDFEARERQWKCLTTKYANKCLTSEREKYGLDNFKTEILALVETQDEAWELEQKFICELNSRCPNGYNMSYGGQTSKGANAGCHNSPYTEFKPLSVVKLKNGVLIKVYNRLLDAAEDNVGCYTSSIAQCCKGNRKTAGGFEWMYKEDYEKMLGFVS